jgi:hypothetical protein
MAIFRQFLALSSSAPSPLLTQTPTPRAALEISRTARPWEFLSAVGKRAGLGTVCRVKLGLSMKILRDLADHTHRGREIPRNVGCTVTASRITTLVYAGDLRYS